MLLSSRAVGRLAAERDAYMVASALPVPLRDHAQRWPGSRWQPATSSPSATWPRTCRWGLRIGINSCPVGSGVDRAPTVPLRPGETVKTASRMESYGSPGQIQITAANRALPDGEFTCIELGMTAGGLSCDGCCGWP